jgi:hypothetical protein
VDWFVKSFLKAAVFWLVTGGAAGFAMAVRPEWLTFAIVIWQTLDRPPPSPRGRPLAEAPPAR